MSPLMFRKHNMGLDVRKLSCGVLQITNAQTSLRIRSDLEINSFTKQGRRRRYGQMCLFGLVWSYFQFPLDFLMRCLFMFTRISIVDAQLDLGLLSA